MPFTTSFASTSSTTMLLKLATLAAAARLAAAATYTLQDSYTTANFFDEFDFYTGADPTHGYVDYQSAAAASASGLAGYSEGGIYLGADYKTSNPAAGRASTRVSSKKSYTHMLLVADVNHMPVGCGTWPALWSFGPDWPSAGEIDIIEGVNSQAANEITLHTAEGCTMTRGTELASTKLLDTLDCGAGDGNTGCPQLTTDTTNFGPGLNAGGGGVYAMEWTSSDISIWFFPRNSSRANALTAGSGNSSSSSSSSSSAAVDTSGFGTPQARFSGGSGCDIDQYFQNHTIIIDTTFCGDWAGKQSVWSADATCSALANTCEDYVASNPEAFVDAYWLFNSINVYQASGDGSSSSSSSSSSTRRAETDSTVRRRVEKYRS